MKSEQPALKHFNLPAGATIHIHGIPFLLVNETTFAGHPVNIEMIGEMVINYAPIEEWLEDMRRPWWKRMLGIG